MRKREEERHFIALRVRIFLNHFFAVTFLSSYKYSPIDADVRSCCMKNGLTQSTCLDRMCDPKKADFNEIADLMLCAPWANISFACLANNINHTPCCMDRGIPADCLSFCTGNVSVMMFTSFRHFRQARFNHFAPFYTNLVPE